MLSSVRRLRRHLIPLHHRLMSLREDRGATTAEYAIVIGAAVGFAGLLVVILRSGEVQEILTSLVRDALGSAG